MPQAVTQERRRFLRSDFPTQVAVNLLQPRLAGVIDGVNVSGGGLCLRLPEALEVRSLVRLQLAPEAAGANPPVECTGRVAWVIQRLDLRDAPPFLFDVGIEFVDPSPLLRRWLTRWGIEFPSLRPSRTASPRTAAAPSAGARQTPGARSKLIGEAVIRGRRYAAVAGRDAGRPPRWHLVVSVEDTPCFSGRYPSERAAATAWARFKRQQGRSEKSR